MFSERNKRNEEEKILKGKKGITLIALVITIIVLLILAGVSIAMLTGNNGILTQAQKAKEETDKASVIEQAQTDILGIQAGGDTTLTQGQLKDILSKYFDPVPDDVDTDDTLTTKVDYGGKYQIAVSDIYNGEIKNVILGKNVLIPNEDGTTSEEMSPYVMYNNLLCRVLYNDDTHGLQIITDDNVTKVTLGYGDTSVTADDFDYEGTKNVSDNFKHALASYNEAVNTLNNKAKEYQGKKAINTRSVGSISTLVNGNFQGDNTEEMWNPTQDYLNSYNLNGKLKKGENNYSEDLSRIVSLKIYPTDLTWLASRAINSNSNTTYFELKNSSQAGGASLVSLAYIGYGVEKVYNPSYGLRPIFLLPFDIIISSGDGTKDNPYIIE